MRVLTHWRISILCVSGAFALVIFMGSSVAREANDELAVRARSSTCTPVEVRTAHGKAMLPNTRLAPIENGRVPCLHVEEMTPASCVFSTASGKASGKWLSGPAGDFAQIGQAVSLDGKPGGEYVVAANVGAQGKAYCTEPTGMDTAGRIAEGVELGITCTLEDILQEYNALSAFGYGQLVNYTTLQVCSRNDPLRSPHPDLALLVRSYPQPGSEVDDTFCYTGYGAGPNDINGTERDETTSYLAGERYCHLVVSSGFEVPGAKRPATRSFPVPGSVVTKSFIVWRPVNPNIAVAN